MTSCFSGTRALVATVLIAASFAAAQPQPAINLRSSANFVVLAASLVSNIPTSAITGDVGLSPATGGNITGFGPTEVIGIIYTVDASGPAGSVPDATRLTAAKGDLTTAYNDAAGRTPVPTGPFLNPDNGSGNIGGQTLVPGLYKFTSSVSITGSNLTLAGSATDVWIFQITSDLNVGNGVQVILSGGARAANVFWQVGTSAILGTTSSMKGTILADQSISMNSGASLEGRALARIAAITLSANTITHPGAATSSLIGHSGRDGIISGSSTVRAINSGRSIEFSVPQTGYATLKLFNVNGSEVATLFNGRAEAGANNIVSLNAETLGRGLYYSQLEINGTTQSNRLMIGR